MAMTLETFRAELARIRARSAYGSSRYPQELRDFAVRYARETAQSTAQAAKELGVPLGSLYGWMHTRRKPSSRLRPVTVVADRHTAQPPKAAPMGMLTVTTAQGHRVDGLSMEQAVALLRGLQ